MHGTRASYKTGCTCLPCKAAEAVYRSTLRQRHAKGRPILGQLVSGVEARRRVRQLKLEGYPAERIAQMAGWPIGRLRFTKRHRIRLVTLLRIRKVAQFAMLEGASDSQPAA